MNQRLKRWLHALLARSLLREGSTRPALLGAYRGLNFYLSRPMTSRLSVFYRGYEFEVSAWLRQQVRPGMTVFIVGGHVGIHVLYVARLLAGAGQVIVFEAWLENFAALEHNVRVNPRLSPQVTLVQAAISEQAATLMMAQGESDGKHHIIESATASAPTRNVTATTLDDYAAAHDLCPDLIVMDIEGHEGAALRGAVQLLTRCKPTLLLEHHGQAVTLTNWLADYDYRVTDLGRRHMIAR